MKYLFVALICGILTTMTLALLMFLIDNTSVLNGVSGIDVVCSPIGGLIAALFNLTWYSEIEEWILK